MSDAPLAALLGARARRVDVPEPDLVALTLGVGELRVALLFSTDPASPGLGCVPERPRGRPAEGVAKQLRNLVEGARLERALDAGGGAIAIDLRRGPDAIALVHESLGDRSNVLVLDAEGAIVAALHPARLAERGLQLGEAWSPPEPSDRARDLPSDLDSLLALGTALVEARRDAHARARRTALDRALRRAHKRALRRAEATLGDLDRANEAPALRARGSALLAGLATIARGATHVSLPDWSTDPPGTLEIDIDPAIGPRPTADALFTRARKLEAGAAIASARHDEAMAEAAKIESIRARLELADDAQIEALETEAARLRIAPAAASAKRKREPESRSPFRRYEGHGGRVILVGKGGTDNDELTFRVASPHDLWVHVRGVPGSHVIVPLKRGEICPPELLVDAAHLAAHFSSARGEPQVEIQHAPRKHLRKPKGGAPGKVIVANERALALRVEPDRLSRLLGREPND
ncbi:NFACT RNA binding domain-containing protein [Sandaracinus amylolyticus]|uniref:NFACT RNA binding domain-containing protein n=1 Tax=Sandaracinus amylolyticus TaxID=927083 RepID=UPI001F24E408|nr:NFACT RNA binding domain-containing protein [Sandaracinus amylolyticus]UJR81780.1 Fibronectin/fibrinogen-binding protein [Sandaracinus amylolyticus]